MDFLTIKRSVGYFKIITLSLLFLLLWQERLNTMFFAYSDDIIIVIEETFPFNSIVIRAIQTYYISANLTPLPPQASALGSQNSTTVATFQFLFFITFLIFCRHGNHSDQRKPQIDFRGEPAIARVISADVSIPTNFSPSITGSLLIFN